MAIAAHTEYGVWLTTESGSDEYVSDEYVSDEYVSDEYGGDDYSGDDYSGDEYSGDDYIGDAYRGDDYGGDDHSGDDYSGDEYSGDDYRGDDYSGDDHSGDDHSGDDHSGDDHSGDDYSGDDYRGDDYGGDEYGGYEYSFVNDPPDRCICKICHHPSRDAYMTGPCCQGLTICKSCLDHWQITAGNWKCPICRREEGGFNKNYPIQREIKSLHIYCTNKEKGCKWQGELNNINNHLGGCQFEEVKCSNECGKMIQRQYLTSHVETECSRRQVNCQYCHDTGEHQFIESQHKEECPKLPLPCPNKCKVGSVPREDMEAHRKQCPLEMIQCEYYSVGCEVRMARKDWEKHECTNKKEHLMMTNHELTGTKAQLAATLKQVSSLTAILMNAQLGPNTAASHANIRSVQLDSMAEIFKCGNQTCPVTIKMSEYSIKRRDEIQWFSDPFYTHNKGYKMCLRVDSAGNGEGRGTHLSVFLYLTKGPHDDKLTWPLRGEFAIKLLNQISDSEHHSWSFQCNDDYNVVRVTEGNRDGGWGVHQYISNEDLNKITPTRQFSKDDCLFFQMHVYFL